MADDDEPRPGLIILDMSNDQMKDVKYNRTPMIGACKQLANSDFFHVVIDCKAFVPKFRQNSKGAKLVDGLQGLDHLQSIPKKQESALDGTTILETLKEMQISHVCLCGSSTDTSVYATVKDLYENEFNIFVVRDAVSSKNGKIGHEKGLRLIESEFGEGIVVGLDALLGDEEGGEGGGEEEYVEEVIEEVPAPAAASSSGARPAPPIAATARSYPPPGGSVKVSSTMAPIKVGGKIPEPKPVKPKEANPDADRLAAQKAKMDANRFADIEAKNKAAAEKAAQAKRDEEERLAVQSGKAAPPPLAGTKAPAKASKAAAAPAPAESAPPAEDKKKKKSFLGGMFGGKKKKDKGPETAPTPAPKAAAPAPPPPVAAPAPAPPAPAPAPAPAQEDKYVYPRPSEKTAPAPKPAESKPETPKAPWMKPQEKKQFPAYTGGARTIATPSSGLQEKMKGLQSGGLSMTNPAQRRMKTPKIVTDTKETWDRDGNITRHITKYITEIDGTKRTEKSTEYIPAK